MKTTRLPLIAALVALAIPTFVCSACVSSGVKPDTADTIAAVVRPVAKNVVNAVLAKNPRYDTALIALAAASDAALNGGTLTIENIKAFVDAFALKHELDPQAKLIIASGIDDLATLYRDTYGKQVAVATDPNVRRILAAFAAGIRDGVAFHNALNAALDSINPAPNAEPVVRRLFGAVGVPAIGRV